MSIVNTFSLQSNRQIKMNFDGGDLSSDAGLLLIKEFVNVNVNIKMIKKWKIKMYIFQDLFLSLCFHKGSFFF